MTAEEDYGKKNWELFKETSCMMNQTELNLKVYWERQENYSKQSTTMTEQET